MDSHKAFHSVWHKRLLYEVYQNSLTKPKIPNKHSHRPWKITQQVHIFGSPFAIRTKKVSMIILSKINKIVCYFIFPQQLLMSSFD